jgi:lipooligosaccharide transport system ATP-binding protein
LQIWGRYFGLNQVPVAQLLEFAGLTGREQSRVGDLSGGMKRRLTLARALVNDPDIIFLDEPTTGLDPQARHLIWDRLRQLTRQGKTLVLTTHFMDEAERLAHRLAVMDHGKLIAQGSPQQLIDSLIEHEVIEVYGDGAVLWAEAQRDSGARLEISGETAFFYGRGMEALLRQLEHSPLRYALRRANLEDVFLRLTGRELRD